MIDMHICKDDKATLRDIRFLRMNYSADNNPLFVIGRFHDNDYSEYSNVIKIPETAKGYMSLFNKMQQADRIHLHGLYSLPMIAWLAFHPGICKRCNWIIWGDDLYTMTKRKTTILSRIFLKLRKYAVTNMNSVATNIPGDVEILKRILDKDIKYYQLWTEKSELGTITVKRQRDCEGRKVKILLGNSATRTNCHEEALQRLKKYADEDMQIICPLSYGDMEYGEQIARYGEQLLGEKFIPLMTYMPKDEYFKLLGDIDIGVFAHDRQQAMGNIVALLYAGKKVFMRKDISSYQFLHDNNGLKIYDFEQIGQINFTELCDMSFDVENQRMLCENMADDQKAVKAFAQMLISENMSERKQ